MGHKNKKSLTRQIQEIYQGKLRVGQSKYEDKIADISKDYIYSYSTFKTYMKEANYFATYCKEKHKCKTIDQCKPYISEWMQSRSDLSPYTQKLDVAALAKLYGVSAENLGIETPERKRNAITRSRGVKKRDSHFSEKKNADIVLFCKCTGLRRSELAAVRGNMLTTDYKGRICINITGNMAKGGRPRKAPIIGDIDRIIEMMNDAGSNKVFQKVPSNMDVHSYRAEYATSIYKMMARPISSIPYDRVNRNGKRYQSQVYVCRSDQKGKKYDKIAMLEASKALGHNRINVVGEHYLRV